ncbi:MAG: hypothetical protein ACYDHM_09115 [Acidiferrobacterales bacterium]
MNPATGCRIQTARATGSAAFRCIDQEIQQQPLRDRKTSTAGQHHHGFRAKGRISHGIVEGLNNKAKLTLGKPVGFRSPEMLEMALLHALGKRSGPKLANGRTEEPIDLHYSGTITPGIRYPVADHARVVIDS